jgi:hypothetical protein
MVEDLGKQVAGLWDRLRNKASDVVAGPSAALVRGKIAANDVFDEAGNLLVGAGKEIDDEVINRATAAGKMPAIVAAAATAQGQDIKEKFQAGYDRTPEGQETRNLADSDDYIEARRYIRWIAGIEVTDIRGNTIVPAGKVIEDEDVRRAREAGQLAALIYSAQQSGPASAEALSRASGLGAAPETGYLPPRRRTSAPLGEHQDE